jgi:peptidyl-prolyl cis-trans isomerase D
MLEQLRRNSKSFIVWILFGIIIAVFIISFGPQSDQISCGSRRDYAVKVEKTEVSPNSWRFGMNGLGFSGGTGGMAGAIRRAQVMDRLIARELLAQAAEEAGFSFSDDVVHQRIAAGDIHILLEPRQGQFIYFKDDAFDYEILERYVTALGLPSVRAFIEEQRRELLAAAMRDVMLGATQVSAEEARLRYVQENTRATLKYARFRPSLYQREISLEPAAVQAYLAGHEKEVKARYEADKARYQKVKPELRGRILFFARKPAAGATSPTTPEEAAGPGQKPAEAATAAAAGAKTADKPASDPAHSRAEAALASIRAGKSFEEVARAQSEDRDTARRGGDIGWRPVDSLGYGNELVEAAKKLAPGQLSGVIESPTGYYVLRVDARREGDLTYDQVKLEIAEAMAIEAESRERARRDAEGALAQATGGKPLDEIFARKEEEASAARPVLQTTAPVQRTGDTIAGVGRSPELVQAVFEGLKPGTLAPRLFEVEDGFALVKLESREEADLKKFTETQAQVQRGYAAEKGFRLLARWLGDRCREVVSGGKVSLNREYIDMSDEGEKNPFPYSPCQSL